MYLYGGRWFQGKLSKVHSELLLLLLVVVVVVVVVWRLMGLMLKKVKESVWV